MMLHWRMRVVACGCAVAAAVLHTAPPAGAHGTWGHTHVTGWAIENLPAGELRDFFADPAVFNAALFGSAYCDSGYWPQGGAMADAAHEYGEHNHWEPFVRDAVAWIRANDPPPWTSSESRQRVAFLMGIAAHGLQDELFDSLFLYQIDEHDGAGQGEADPAADGFLVMDGHIRFEPTPFLPMETLLELYAGLSHDITADVVQQAVDLMMFIYLNHETGLAVAQAAGEQHEAALPWAREHYMDAAVPGSFLSEVYPTARYLEALWARFHGAFPTDAVVSYSFPAPPRRLRSHDAERVDSWVTLVFGIGLKLDEAVVSWVDADGAAVPFDLKGTRWGADYPRLIRLQPQAPLTPGGWYTVELAAGPALIDGTASTAPFALNFQVECTPETADLCEPLGDLPVPVVDGSGPPPEPEPEPQPEPGPEPAPDTTPDAPATTGGSPDEGCAAAPPTSLPALLLLLLIAGHTHRRRQRR